MARAKKDRLNRNFKFSQATYTAFQEKVADREVTKVLEVLMRLYAEGALEKLVQLQLQADALEKGKES